MIIYTNHITPRLQYILSVLFNKQIEITTNKTLFQNTNAAKINYSENRISENEIWVNPHPLLSETTIKPQNINCFEWNGLKAFYKTGGDLPFDIFSASFYLISRYEEWLPHSKDEYGRYGYTNSIAYKENFLNQPLVNLWMKEFEKIIIAKSPGAVFQTSQFQFLPTYDIDIAYNYTGKGFWRNTSSFVKALFTGNFKKIAEQIRTVTEKQKDPFDIYDWLNALHSKSNIEVIYFFLLANKNRHCDKNILPKKTVIKELIKNISAKNKIGIHPSWQSGDNEKLLKNEIEILGNISQQKINSSRQHYIRMSFPETYQSLIKNNITHDYSMGYGSINGFRASYAKPFVWYDLEKEENTGLIIHPFCYMDANAFFEEKLSVRQADEELNYYFSITKSVNGEFSIIHHNHFLTEQNEWSEWRKMYEDFIKNSVETVL